MGRLISQKLIFNADKVINPEGVLLSEGYFQTARDLEGSAYFNFCAIPLYGKKTTITSISASLAENYSSIGRSVHPVSQLGFYTYNSDTISFLDSIDESKLAECKLEIDNEPIRNFDDLKKSYYTSEGGERFVKNVIKFNSDLSDKLLYLPRSTKNEPSIVDSMKRFFQLSFTELASVSYPITIPSQASYLLIFPFVTMPIRSSLILKTPGNLAVAIFLNILIEEE